MWQYMLICGVGAKPVTLLMQYHLLQWEVAKVKQLMTSNMTLTVLNLHQKTPKGATTKIQVKRYERYKRDKIVSHIPVECREIQWHQICKIKGQIQVTP